MESNTKDKIKEETNSKNSEKPETIQENINSISNADTQEVKPAATPIKNLIDSSTNNINILPNKNEITSKNTQSQSGQNSEQNMNNQTKYKFVYIYIFGIIVFIASIIFDSKFIGFKALF